MKINIDKAVVNFIPENENEQDRLEALWRELIDCNGYALKLAPIGEYVPAEGKTAAAFYIEGLNEKLAKNTGAEAAARAAKYTPVYAEEDNTAYCSTCNKTVALKAGDEIPLCCGRLMELID
ncbi:MAG: hypothetical protein LBS91_08005 [Clostridiales Family XIII bacterium]|jgi:hypothetical protein|nr:hypothetical protein [Clostridiales Family XIII bacterium]